MIDNPAIRLEQSELLIKELYVNLREAVNRWSLVTQQTPQARMGYVGQHLVSIVTGYPGGKSGARGHDLILPNRRFGEIKTCYRVDQLGDCKKCGEKISALENECPNCGSRKIQRKNDSKWLITIRNDKEFQLMTEPKYYYFALFEFEDYLNPTISDIRCDIYRVNTKAPGFIMCLIDYYKNYYPISKTAFNLWPHSIKFSLMEPISIYESTIYHDGRIETSLFPDITEPKPVVIDFDRDLIRQRTISSRCVYNTLLDLSPAPISVMVENANISVLGNMLSQLIVENATDYVDVCRQLAWNCYYPLIESYYDILPPNLKAILDSYCPSA